MVRCAAAATVLWCFLDGGTNPSSFASSSAASPGLRSLLAPNPALPNPKANNHATQSPPSNPKPTSHVSLSEEESAQVTGGCPPCAAAVIAGISENAAAVAVATGAVGGALFWELYKGLTMPTSDQVHDQMEKADWQYMDGHGMWADNDSVV